MSGQLKNDYVNKPIVIDSGSRHNSFKSVAYLKSGEGIGLGSNIYALNIEEYVDKEFKPFIYMENSRVFKGLCKKISDRL